MMSQPQQSPASKSRQREREVSHCAGLPAAELHSDSFVSDQQKRRSSRRTNLWENNKNRGKNIPWMAPGTCSRNMERSDCDLKGKSKRKRRRRCKGKGESSSCDCWTSCGKQMMMLTQLFVAVFCELQSFLLHWWNSYTGFVLLCRYCITLHHLQRVHLGRDILQFTTVHLLYLWVQEEHLQEK